MFEEFINQMVDSMNEETQEMPSALEVIMALADMDDDE